MCVLTPPDPTLPTITSTPTKQVDKVYKDLKPVGKGSYGIVCSAVNSETGEAVAIKRVSPISAHVIDAKHVLREIRMMRCVRACMCPSMCVAVACNIIIAPPLIPSIPLETPQIPGPAPEHNHAQGPLPPRQLGPALRGRRGHDGGGPRARRERGGAAGG